MRTIAKLLLLISTANFTLLGGVSAQQPNQVVRWSASAASKEPLKAQGRTTLELSAEIQDGWHVYALKQLPGGPTPLRIALEENSIGETAGSIYGTPPTIKHDSSFDLETQSYAHSLILHIPVQIKANATAGPSAIPVSVRYQSCDDRTCLPPKTIHLSVSVEVVPRS
jgi:DsbC/DsbD-like thiol-disulfide interchange protein